MVSGSDIYPNFPLPLKGIQIKGSFLNGLLITRFFKIHMKEIFKPVQNFPKYQVSNKGNVLTLHGLRPRLLAQSINRYGYKVVHLSDGVSRWGKNVKVHRLVALHHLPKRKDSSKLEVNHIIGTAKGKLNNKVTNLEWVNRSENVKHAFKNKLKSNPKGKNNKLSDKNIYYLNHSTKNKIIKGVRYDLMLKAKLSISEIKHLVLGKRKAVRGWKLIKKENQ